MLMNHYRVLDRDKVQFDFLLHGLHEGEYEAEVKTLGGRVFHAPLIRPWTYPKYFKWLDRFFAEHAGDYVAVHGHIQENSGLALHYAKKYGISNRLMSSHAAPATKDYKFIFREFARLYFKKSVTHRLACGEAAGKHLYRNEPFEIIHNAIDTSRFDYDEATRNELRHSLGIDADEFVVGHVGRFDANKNHKFLLEVFDRFLKAQPKSKLVLVGDGELFDDIKNKVEHKGLTGKVILTGSRADVDKLLQAFDVFVLTSIYEGLPVSVIEAQAAGLPCVLSDTIDIDCDITGNIEFLPLDAPVSEWAETLGKYRHFERKSTFDQIAKAGYEVNANLKKLLGLYGINNG